MVTLMSEILQIIGRLRRAMPRNPDVMAACDWVDRMVSVPRASIEAPLARTEMQPAKPKLSRAEIQRNYRLRKKARPNG